jgi:hypothetical protein
MDCLSISKVGYMWTQNPKPKTLKPGTRELELQAYIKIRGTFHVSLLKPFEKTPCAQIASK